MLRDISSDYRDLLEPLRSILGVGASEVGHVGPSACNGNDHVNTIGCPRTLGLLIDTKCTVRRFSGLSPNSHLCTHAALHHQETHSRPGKSPTMLFLELLNGLPHNIVGCGFAGRAHLSRVLTRQLGAVIISRYVYLARSHHQAPGGQAHRINSQQTWTSF
jgi:hypothetical protein